MNWLKKKKQSEDSTYWQIVADALAALLLVVLLILMLLMLFIVRVPDNENVDMYEGDKYHGMLDPEAGAGDHGDHDLSNGEARYWQNGDEEEGDGDDFDNDGGGGAIILGFPEEGKGDGEEEGYSKAAVYVMVLDAETERTIKMPGIRFELYNDKEALQILNTYYPKKKEYRNFETTSDGVFYLPEKLDQGSYSLHEITAPKGYDPAGNLAMELYEDYDWPDPYVARVYLSPSKNIIRIQMTDMDTGANVTGGSYEVVAAENITTQDGTLRYNEGQIVTEIVCNASGYGQSMELYLGKYLLREKKIPLYYAQDAEPTEVTVEHKTNVLPAIQELPCRKTIVTIHVADELYGNIPIKGAGFEVSHEGTTKKAQTAYTNEYGELVLTDLIKNASYRVHQISTAQGYTPAQDDLFFAVTAGGYVDAEVWSEKELTNRTLRASVAVKGAVLQAMASDYNVALYNGLDELVSVWDSTGMAHVVEGLEPGDYYIRLGGNAKNQKHIVIRDQKELQPFTYSVWTTADIAAVAAISVFAAGLFLIAASLLKRRRMAAPAVQEDMTETEDKEENHYE